MSPLPGIPRVLRPSRPPVVRGRALAWIKAYEATRVRGLASEHSDGVRRVLARTVVP